MAENIARLSLSVFEGDRKFPEERNKKKEKTTATMMRSEHILEYVIARWEKTLSRR